MPNKKVLITGATGFVGNRLAERMAMGGGYDVSVLIHRFTGPGLARLARLPVEFLAVDILDLKALETAFEELDLIVHMAYGTSGSDTERSEVTVSGTENILRLGLAKKVDKIICFSTAAVHGINPQTPIVTETSPYERSTDVYRESKIEAEELVWRFHAEHGLPVVVFRPPLIYGPNGAYWTTRLLKEVQDGAILVNGGNGRANLIYVDNLIDAVFLAIEKKSGDGESFIVVDDDELTWKQVYEAYASRLTNCPPMVAKTISEIETIRNSLYPNTLKNNFYQPLTLIPKLLKTGLKDPEMRHNMMLVPWLRYVKNKFSREKLKAIKEKNDTQVVASIANNVEQQKKLPHDDLVQLYASKARFSNEKIKRLLGYEQRISFQEAVVHIDEWARYQGIIT